MKLSAPLLLACLLVQPLAAAAPLAGRAPRGAAAEPVAAARPAVPGDDEIVKEFKKYFRKYKDTATRVEAVRALEGTDSRAVVAALLPVLRDKDPDVVRAAVQVLARLRSPEAIAEVWARLADTKDEGARVGLLRAAAEGRYTGGGEVLSECLGDRSWEVRRRAVTALSAAGGADVEALVEPLCEDGEPAVRCAAMEGLASLRSGRVVQHAIAALDDASWQVRASAIHALGSVRRKESIAPLIARMEVEEGRLVADLGEALASITGRDFGQRLDGWQRFWESYGERFEIPTDEELAALRAARQKRADEYKPPGTVAYHGIETPSRSILFVIDVSGSMENLVVETERFADGGYPSFRRIDIVKTELARTIEGLESYVRFNILSFATEVDQWKKRLVPANVLNKSSAVDWAKNLEALGGSSKSDLARAGLTGAANLEAGRTNTYGALTRALGVTEEGVRDEDYQVDVDTVFFLSDGRPSTGKYVDVHDILREIGAANELRKVVIHTIAIGEFQKDFMRALAEQSFGVFVDLGR